MFASDIDIWVRVRPRIGSSGDFEFTRSESARIINEPSRETASVQPLWSVLSVAACAAACNVSR